jgi:hypothetical protein
MRNVQMIRYEPDLISIPVEKAVYCENCEMVSTSSRCRCGLCGSEEIVELASLFVGPVDPTPPPASAAEVRLAPERLSSLNRAWRAAGATHI